MATYNYPLGTDDSHWDGPIDFAALAKSGACFTYFKAGQGSWEDGQFERSMGELKKYPSILGGAYWYYDNRYKPLDQAAAFLRIVRPYLSVLSMGLVIDFEDRQTGVYKGWRNLAVMLAEIRKNLPTIKIPIYTAYYYWLEFGPSKYFNYSSYIWFKQFPLWLAQYGPAVYKIPGPWDKWTFWQFTEDGDAPKYGGQAAGMDLNYFNGSYDDLASWANVAVQEPAPVPIVTYSGTVVATDGLSVRSSPNVSANRLAVLSYGTPVIGDEIRRISASEEWLHITSPVVGWSAIMYGSRVLIRLA